MNAIEQARQAYAPTQFSIRTNRSVEAQLFSQITARLRQAATGQPTNFPALVAAVHENRRMWAAMAADVADGDNALPRPLRAQIFYLAEFTETHSRRVLRHDADVSALIDINTAVIRGLNSRGVA
ncbi:flagellar biosynthesis regulator FlaF [Yoonia sp.]|uniref:flagellar biosynthesis regulator FlaF n=1 Tax=Yoonia sp. TaxID=2212373 RepID=UPI0019F2C5DB|nr:flagellar biosynthesis regulator FlaF [Yoonia sp.]MBE0413773.1 flagellar biosynthesis regulator FlaF [Yoonia sp.]